MEVTATLSITLPSGKTDVPVLLKSGDSIADCTIGKAVSLTLVDGQEFNGFIHFIDGDEIVLKSFHGRNLIGLDRSWIETYWEQTTEPLTIEP